MADDEKQGFVVEFYETQQGRKPAMEFLNSLDRVSKEAVVAGLKELEIKGNLLEPPKTKPLRDKLFELRVKSQRKQHRVIYFFMIGRRIVLTNGFVKKTRTTPYKEIELAKKYKEDFERRIRD